MKITGVFLLMLATGIAGLVLFFGDCSSIVRLILSKPVGILLLYISYLLHGILRSQYKSINR